MNAEVRKELSINVAGRELKVFMQPDFFGLSASSTRVHKNAYTELHCIEAGPVEYTVDGERFFAEAGELIIIPAGIFHSKKIENGDAFRACIFQVDIAIPKILRRRLSPDIYTELIRYAEEYNKEGHSVRLSAYLSLICSYLFEDSPRVLTNVRDRQFMIREFFYNHYYLDAKLGDLSAILNLSDKQTERCVLECTGRSFRKELAFRRIEAAKHLLKTESITLKDAAERVGYKSYNGFWKAFKLFSADRETY